MKCGQAEAQSVLAENLHQCLLQQNVYHEICMYNTPANLFPAAVCVPVFLCHSVKLILKSFSAVFPFSDS